MASKKRWNFIEWPTSVDQRERYGSYPGMICPWTALPRTKSWCRGRRVWFTSFCLEGRYHGCKALRRRSAEKLTSPLVLDGRVGDPQVVLVMMCGAGGLVFRYTEGAFETFYKCGVKRVKRDFLDGLWTDSRRMGEDQWKLAARRKLIEFEGQLHDAFEAGATTYSGRSSWSFVNSAIYCFTVITTIGTSSPSSWAANSGTSP